MDDISRDTLANGTVTLLQPRRGHRVGLDAVLLAEFAEIGPGDRVADLGCATGAVGLLIAQREPGASLVFVERDPDLADLCRRNVAENGLAERARVVSCDLFAPRAERASCGIAGHDLDVVATNPPFFDPSARPSPDPGRRAAHALSGGTLRDWLGAAADCLRPRGRFAMIHRADQLGSCLAAMDGLFGSPTITPVHSRPDRPAVRVLIGAIKGGRAPLLLNRALTLPRPASGQQGGSEPA